ncbi:MAG: SAM-dependent methyltransferase [Phycisphaeraceae bacterium]|nr:SAM-dependent methyltransferase [Phycisphaeraceae bacterium]
MKPGPPSSTAWYVAAATVYLAGDATLGRLVPPEAIPPTLDCLRLTGLTGKIVAANGFKPWFRGLAARRERRLLPGLSLHIAARKKYIEAAVRQAIADGFRQVIVLGAGYDMLALRLHREYPKVVFIEIDRAPTQRIKLAGALSKDLPSPNLAAVPANFGSSPLASSLASCPVHRAGLDTVYIAEGLLMYLAPDEVTKLLAELASLTHRRTRLVFTFLEPVDDGLPGLRGATHRLDRLLRRSKEQFRWGVPRDGLAGFMQKHGFTVSDVAGPQTFRQRFLPGIAGEQESLAAGEYAAVADHVGKA